MPARKRGREELELDEPATNYSVGLLTKLRNTWQMANLMQWLYLFGKEHKIDESFDMEALEEQCLKPGPSVKLVEIGLCLLKHVSSHRGLTSENFDEYTRRQYVVRRPHDNPFGEEEQPRHFNDFDVFEKLRVLHQLTIWAMSNPERFRERMAENRDNEQTQWRIEEIGWDSEERSHFVLDDNRLYRRTPKPAPPPPAPKSKPKAKAKSKFRPRPKGSRTSKRRKIEHSEGPEDVSEQEAEVNGDGAQVENVAEDPDDGLGGDKWECLCVTLEEYQNFVERFKRSKDPNEKTLYKRLVQDVMPIIEKAEEDRAKKIARRERELLTLEKLATAKRSSRIASRVEKEKDEQLARKADEKYQKGLAAAREDAKRQKDMDAARMSRMMTREQRLKDREYKRILHEEELKNMQEEQEKMDAGENGSKKSERHLKAEMKKTQEALENLKEEDDWVFDCSGCGVHGQNIDDGKHSIACERCSVWQHSACLGLSKDEAEKDDFIFICNDCKRKEEDAKLPKIAPLKFKLGSLSPSQGRDNAIRVEAASQFLPTDSSKPTQAESDNRSTIIAANSHSIGSAMPPTKKFKAYFPKEPIKHPKQVPTTKSSNTGTRQHTINGGNGMFQQSTPTHLPEPNGVKLNGNHLLVAHATDQNGTGVTQEALPAAVSVPYTPAFARQADSSISKRAEALGLTDGVTAIPAATFPHLPPPQTTPSSSFSGNTPNASFKAQSSFPSTPAHPLVPEKQPSAAPSPIAGNSLLKASPSIVPPASLSQEAKVSGISPVKNGSQPQPTHVPKVLGNTAKLPEKLQSPQ